MAKSYMHSIGIGMCHCSAYILPQDTTHHYSTVYTTASLSLPLDFFLLILIVF